MTEVDYPAAADLQARIASGAVRVTEAADVYLAQIAAEEPRIGAWAWHDPEHVRAQAKALEAHRASGRSLGGLHGLPVGVKDIIDTAGIPTENGCGLDAGRIPEADAFVVSRLKQAGAVVMGKTTTTELAFMDACGTRNPHDVERTPGGSSSGSAAAVAAGMVPLAIGTQTAGSVIRPASYCGVVGYKPSYGAIPRTGVLRQAGTLDTIGVFARTVADAAMLVESLIGYDRADAATSASPPPRLFDVATSAPPVTPALAFVRQPAWELAEEDTRSAFAELVDALGESCVEIDLPPAFGEGLEAAKTIQIAELAKCFYPYARRGLDRLGPKLRSGIAAGDATPARDYLAALDWPRLLNAMLGEIFDRFDALVTPAAPGPAPKGLDATGDPVFNKLWTLCGTPAITIPALQAGNGMPLGVQLVGRRGDDARLLRTARWLSEFVSSKVG